MPSEVVRYLVDRETIVEIEIEPTPGFTPASFDDTVGAVREALGSALATARLLLDEIKRDVSPSSVEVKFGVKVTGTANWLVAKTATEGNFEVALTWTPPSGPHSGA